MTDTDHPPYGLPTLLDESGAVLVSTTSVQKKSPWGMRVGLLAAAAAVAGVGALAVRTALSEPAGPQSPEEAVTQLFEALGNEDVLGMTEVMLPSERESLVEPGLAIFTELQRLEVLDAEADLGQMPYFDITIEGLELTSTPVTDGLTMVETTGGMISASGSGAVPLADRFDLDTEAWTEEPTPMGEDPLKMAVVEEDGSWYVSLWYSGAEAARTDAGEAGLPVIGGGPTPVGAESPEAVVEALIENMAALDAEGVLTLLDPEEARILYDYSNLYLPELESSIDEFKADAEAEGATWSVEAVETESAEVNGRTVVALTSIEVAMSGPDLDMQMTLAGDCVTTVASGVTEEFCPEDVEELGFGLFGGLVGTDSWKAELTVVERNGRWYVSLIPSMLYRVNDVLVEMEPADIDAMIDGFDELVNSALDLGMGFGGTGLGATGFGLEEETTEFESVGDSIDGEYPSDPAVVPPGADSWGADPEFTDIAFAEIDMTGAVATEVLDADGGYITVVTMPDTSHVEPYIDYELGTWGYQMMDPSLVPAGLPAGTQVIDQDDGFAAFLYGPYLISVFDEGGTALAIEVLSHLAAGG